MTTGIIDIDNPGSTIIGYPNPFSQGITISGLSSLKKYTLHFYDSRGVLVRSYIVNKLSLKHFTTPGLVNGVYWINIIDTKKQRLIGTLVAIKQ
jgi:hypothetical protein